MQPPCMLTCAFYRRLPASSPSHCYFSLLRARYTENGFPSVGFIEPRGYTGDPMYHTSGDLVERDEYSITQLTLAAQAALAAGAELADMNFGTD